MLRITIPPAHKVAPASTIGLLLRLCLQESILARVPGSALQRGPAACQTGGWGVHQAPPPTSPAPPTKLWGLSRCPLCAFSAAPLRHGVRDPAIRALHVLLCLRVCGRQEDPDQACDGHRRRADGRGHRAGEGVARPGCRGSSSKPAEKGAACSTVPDPELLAQSLCACF